MSRWPGRLEEGRPLRACEARPAGHAAGVGPSGEVGEAGAGRSESGERRLDARRRLAPGPCDPPSDRPRRGTAVPARPCPPWPGSARPPLRSAAPAPPLGHGIAAPVHSVRAGACSSVGERPCRERVPTRGAIEDDARNDAAQIMARQVELPGAEAIRSGADNGCKMPTKATSFGDGDQAHRRIDSDYHHQASALDDVPPGLPIAPYGSRAGGAAACAPDTAINTDTGAEAGGRATGIRLPSCWPQPAGGKMVGLSKKAGRLRFPSSSKKSQPNRLKRVRTTICVSAGAPTARPRRSAFPGIEHSLRPHSRSGAGIRAIPSRPSAPRPLSSPMKAGAEPRGDRRAASPASAAREGGGDRAAMATRRRGHAAGPPAWLRRRV